MMRMRKWLYQTIIRFRSSSYHYS